MTLSLMILHAFSKSVSFIILPKTLETTLRFCVYYFMLDQKRGKKLSGLISISTLDWIQLTLGIHFDKLSTSNYLQTAIFLASRYVDQEILVKYIV